VYVNAIGGDFVRCKSFYKYFAAPNMYESMSLYIARYNAINSSGDSKIEILKRVG